MPILICFSLTLTLLSYSKGDDWSINVTRSFNVTKGSDVTVLCSFTYPSQYHTDDVQVYWKTRGQSECSRKDLDRNAFVFHPNDTCVLPKYRRKTKVIGDKAGGNCSLQIRNIMVNEPFMYVRVSGRGRDYSFKKDYISISVKAMSNTSVDDNLQLYLAIFIPVAAIALIIFVTGIVIYTTRERSQTFSREESKFYVNFSKRSSNPSKSETSCETDFKASEKKVIDEPIYINYEGRTEELSQSLDNIDSIYANVDYSR
ncbi:uncharacterized protein LOC133428892 [Cololabis saira]|uniref:uncharacterized protein LOC133428892 n=1 Tax=Cololabis saira TaxID=129043 RepID=UPI002AD26827|nr:uncharacterized protein LOC133428892 [Cololabis saira]XP_061572573.1 uncharacterized protein LOC133428892 [Cololabis saira]